MQSSGSLFGAGLFRRLHNGQVVFYPHSVWGGYIVPDTDCEQRLVLFLNRTEILVLLAGVVLCLALEFVWT